MGQTILVTGEIAEDLTYYFATSEQIPSSVALGVLMNRDNTVSQSGGFIIQLMPGAPEDMIDRLEARLKEIASVTTLLDEGNTPEMILEHVLGEFGLELNDRVPVPVSYTHLDVYKRQLPDSGVYTGPLTLF